MCGDDDIPGPVEGKNVDGSGVLFLRVAVDARLPPQCEDGNRLRFAFFLCRSLDLLCIVNCHSRDSLDYSGKIWVTF